MKDGRVSLYSFRTLAQYKSFTYLHRW